MTWEALCMIAVSVVWGCSNPFLKRGSEEVQRVRGSGLLHQILLELWFLATHCSYTVPFLINQSGSVLYYLTVAKMDLSLAVPIINSLTVLFTTLVRLLYTGGEAEGWAELAWNCMSWLRLESHSAY